MPLAPASPLRSLLDRFPRPGRLEWIGLRPARLAPPRPVDAVEALAGRGLAGDRYAGGAGGRRQVTLIQREHLAVIGALLGGGAVDPALLRRNLVVSGINLLALHDRLFEIGGVVFEGAGVCEPCSRMEAALGAGGCNAMRGHGGIVARVIAGGVLRVGDAVRWRAAPR
jgi:MOSC domain-containing protein YiiM